MKKTILLLLLISLSILSKAQVYSWSGLVPILDMQTDTIFIPVSGMTAVIDTNYGIAHVCLDITHTYDADLVVKIISPDGDSVSLIQGIGGSGDNFMGTCLGMDGTLFSNASAPYLGIFVPFENLASLNDGQNPNGMWKIIVRDIAYSDTGSVHHASIEFINNPPQQTGIGSGVTAGPFVCPTCVCPGGAAGCDLLPDMISSAQEIQINHNEVPGLLYVSNATPNIGSGPLEIFGIDSCFCGTTHVPCTTTCPSGQTLQRVIKQRIYQKVPGNDTLTYYDRFAGTMTHHPTHGHLHVDNFANFTLRTATSNPDATTWPIVGTSAKQSFCLINLGTCAGNPGECKDMNGNIITSVVNNGLGYQTGCGLTQGIYAGSYDVYSMGLNDPIPLNNVCNGNYYIVSITDPNDNFLESDETNNWVAVPITLTQQGSVANITANGPLTFCAGDSVILTSSFAPSYLWSTGATTQSITVKVAGTYTVSVSCGTTTTTSLPVTTSIVPTGGAATVSIALTMGANPSCPGLAHTFTATPNFGGTSPIFQWKVDGVNVGTNSPTYTTSALTNAQVVTCQLTSSSNCLASQTATSNAITMSIGTMVCYCTPLWGTTASSGCLDGDLIARVTLNTLDNNSGSACPSGIAGYADYTTSTNPLHTTSLQAGSTYTCTVYAGQYGEGYKAWIDYNNDGVFSASETLGYSSGIVAGSGTVGVTGSSASFNVVIPCNAQVGVHRLRVRCSYNNNGINIDPCNLMNNYGEAEDYNITILPPSGCPQPSALTATNISATGVTLSWAAGCTETLWNVHVTSVGGGAPLGMASHPNVLNPVAITGLTASTTYEYWVSANCSSTSLSAWAGPFQFTTLPICSTIPGTSKTNPIVIGQAPCISVPFVNVRTNTTANCFSNNYAGANNQASPDVWYRFTLAAPATVQISHCASAFDTYLHLLDSSGTQLQWNDDNGPLCAGLRASISVALAAGTYYVVSEGYNTGTGAITTSINTIDVCPTNTILNVKCFVQGYWNGANAMFPVLSNQGVATTTTACDSIDVELHASSSPYAKLYASKGLLNQNGTVSFNFPLIYGSYYIAMKHRNALQTWSANPISFSHIPANYDFSTNNNKSYGSNQVQVSSSVWAMYSGDITGDGNIDLLDAVIQEADVMNFSSGYIPSDLNGDGNADLLDSALLEGNINNFIYAVMP